MYFSKPNCRFQKALLPIIEMTSSIIKAKSEVVEACCYMVEAGKDRMGASDMVIVFCHISCTIVLVSPFCDMVFLLVLTL